MIDLSLVGLRERIGRLSCLALFVSASMSMASRSEAQLVAYGESHASYSDISSGWSLGPTTYKESGTHYDTLYLAPNAGIKAKIVFGTTPAWEIADIIVKQTFWCPYTSSAPMLSFHVNLNAEAHILHSAQKAIAEAHHLSKTAYAETDESISILWDDSASNGDDWSGPGNSRGTWDDTCIVVADAHELSSAPPDNPGGDACVTSKTKASKPTLKRAAQGGKSTAKHVRGKATSKAVSKHL